ncbi:sugar ABC transporter substrate-binding protein [Paenibacillus sp. GD4]|jgi:multiple sugar transport system substrate-binding protein|uniref:ABC transporter substrate-binding protein n=1 Tax=Paenibacillus sp. GD4 TaxID=3068890 RepID=UPI0027964F7E|nr:sugar ABC transporter substrate-binding protein [Paenibacillus sp. GD4]MDQ1909682.1 sugar ABC transporter substrate-binding protein [Paenibacillus sp. GD4]
MIRKMGFVTVSSLLAVSLAACSSTTPPAGKPGEQAGGTVSKEKKKLVYWTNDRHDMDYIKGVVQKFNESNQDSIEVEMVVKTEDFNQAIDLAFASGQAPDIIRVKENTIQPFVQKGYLKPIDTYVTEDMKKKFPVIDDFNRLDGKLYSLPNYGSTLRLVYNKDLFAKAGLTAPPKTLKEMVDYAKKITAVGKANGSYGFAQNFKSPESALNRSARVIAEASGIGGLGYDFKTARYDFTGFKEIIQAFKQMVDDGSTLPGMESLDIDPLRAQFAEGKIGMYISFSSEPGVYKSQFPAKIDWAAAPVPTIDGTVKGATSFLGGQWLSISSTTKNPDLAWKFMQHMYNDDVLKTYHENGFGLSMVPSISSAAKKPDIKGIEGFLPNGMDGTWPLNPPVTVEGIKNTDAFFKYMISGGNLDEIIADLNKRYNEALDKAIAKGSVQAKPNPSFDPMKLVSK